MTEKFNDVDRYVIKEWLENYLQTKLKKKKGHGRKYFSGDNGKCYCVLGGEEEFHGISKEFIDSEARECIDTELVIVKKYKNKFEIYMNSIEKLIKNKDKLSLSRTGTREQYEFNIIIEKGFLKIKEFKNLPYYFEKIGEIPYDKEKKNQAKINFKLYKDFLESVSQEERERLELEFKSKGYIKSIF